MLIFTLKGFLRRLNSACSLVIPALAAGKLGYFGFIADPDALGDELRFFKAAPLAFVIKRSHGIDPIVQNFNRGLLLELLRTLLFLQHLNMVTAADDTHSALFRL